MKVKFLLLMTFLILFLTLALVIPNTQLEIYTLNNQSVTSTKDILSVLAYNVGGPFYNYYGSDEKAKKDFKITLQEGLPPIKSKWKSVNFISIIDKDKKIIADTRATNIDKIYNDYQNIPGFDKAIAEVKKGYNDKIANLPKDQDSTKKEITSLDEKLKAAPKETQTDIETQISQYKSDLSKLDVNANKAKYAISIIDKDPISALIEPVIINGDKSYTIFYPILPSIETSSEKIQSYGTIVASVSTDFIYQTINRIIMVAIGIALIVLLLSLIIIQVYLKIMIQPIIYLTSTVKQVAAGNMDLKVPVTTKDEIGVLGNEFNNLIRIWREKLHMEKYISKSTADMITKAETGEYNKEPRREKITVFFSDVRGFTSYSERHDPLDVVKNLNKLFDIQVAVIEKNKGDIDKFVGDEIMALFPSPNEAYSASVEIQKAMVKFNTSLDDKEKLAIGIGINYGEAIVGSIGSGNYFDWTAIGDTINLGARLCGAAPANRILISEDAFNLLTIKDAHIENVKSNPAASSEISVKGKQKPIKIYTI